MSKSFEIIDPSLHVMVDKAYNQTSIISENKKLKNLNTLIIISAVVIISISLVYYQYPNTDKDS